MATRKRKPGRPAKPALEKQAVFDAALDLLEDGGLDALTMRGVAKKLGVDPMTLYWHFESKDALLREAADASYAKLRVKLPAAKWPAKLHALGDGYAKFVRNKRALVAWLAQSQKNAKGAASHFDALFREAVDGAHFDDAFAEVVRDALVDLAHGSALAGRSNGAAFERELELLIAGIEARAR